MNTHRTHPAFIYVIPFLLLCFCAMPDIHLTAQCNLEPLPTGTCVDAPEACLIGQCYSTVNNPPTGEPVNWCGMNVQVHNPQYFQITAVTSDLHIEIHVNICFGGGCGLQSAILDTCDWDLENVVACDPGTPVGGTMVLDFPGATPGKTYWILIDGCGGQICEYEYTVTRGIDTPVTTQMDTTTCSDSLLYQDVTYAVGLHEVVFDDGRLCDSIIILNVMRKIEVDLGDVEICYPVEDSAFVTPIVTGPPGSYTYLWYDGDTSAARWLYGLTPGDVIYVTVTDSVGCSARDSTSVSTSLQVTLEVPDGFPCIGAIATEEIGVLVENGTPPYTFTWTPPLPEDIVYPPATHTLKVTDSVGCETEAGFSLEEIPHPVPMVQPTGNFCADQLREGVLVSLQDSGLFNQYEWYLGTSLLSTTTYVVIRDTGEYMLHVLDTGDCSGSVSFYIGELPSPKVSLDVNSDVCPDVLAQGIEITIITDPLDIDSLVYFGAWNAHADSVFSPGIYGVLAIDSFGCKGVDSVDVAPLHLPEAAFYTLVSGLTVVFVNTSNYGTSYAWNFGDGGIDTSKHPLHVFDTVQTYSVQLITSNGCGADTITQAVTTSLSTKPENNTCDQATDLGVLVHSRNDCGLVQELLTCTTRTNLFADPDARVQSCFSGDAPVVWFTFQTNELAAILNVEIRNASFRKPFIQLYQSPDSTCDFLLGPIGLAKNKMSCGRGSGGKLVVHGTAVQPSTTYYLAVGSADTTGGLFDVCLGTLEMSQAPCVTDATLEITSRSMGGPLHGPFFPGEEVGICMQVNTFVVSTGVQNCQWFQGLVPVFGNGWDPGSFGAEGQPIGATMNDLAFPAPAVHNSGTWEWWAGVPYHHEHCFYNVLDLDGNGTTDMCHALYDADCPGAGFQQACCGPCWGSTGPTELGNGTVLPPGWFTAGVDGTCGLLRGWPAVDWGDGNTCNGPTGPWEFCFTLKVNERIDTVVNPELSVGFFTFSDGEVGAWTGGQSVCMNDMPVRLFLPFCTEPGLKPEASFKVSKGGAGMVDFINSSQLAYGYYWDFGDGAVSDLSNPEHTYTQNGVYTVILIAFGECTNDTISQEVSVTVTGTTDFQYGAVVRVYPNPGSGIFILHAEGFTGQFEVKIVDMYGRSVLTQPFVQNSTSRHHIRLDDVASGVYLVVVHQGATISSARVVLLKS